jgi:hypothetical protein
MFNLNIDSTKYNSIKPYPHTSVNNVLSPNFATLCQTEILSIPDNEWDRYDNPFEGKYTLRNKNNIPENCMKLFNYLTSDVFLKKLSIISNEKIYNDPTKNWWGIHKYNNGDHLDIHCDAGIHPITNQKKHLTLGIYLSKDWKEENGGHLEIWDGDDITINNPKLNKCINKILPLFNTLVLFTCNNNAWHGNPTPVHIINNEKRIFLTISYLSENHNEIFSNTLEKAYFIKRPSDKNDDNKDKLRLLRCDPIKYKEIYNLSTKK